MSLRTPLGRVLGHGSAREGTEHFFNQRVTGVALVLLGGWFAWSMFRIESMAYLEVIRFIGQPLNTVLLVLFSAVAAFHSWLGVQVVIEDYVHAPATKMLSLLAARFVHVLVAAVAIYSILRIGFEA